jgi:hypothetical protein
MGVLPKDSTDMGKQIMEVPIATAHAPLMKRKRKKSSSGSESGMK